MKSIAHDPYVSPEIARELEVDMLPLQDLLKQADYISLHTSLSAATEKMVNAESIAQMKRGARIINCARRSLNSRTSSPHPILRARRPKRRKKSEFKSRCRFAIISPRA